MAPQSLVPAPVPGPVNASLFGKAILADAIKAPEGSSWIFWMNPKSNDKCSCTILRRRRQALWRCLWQYRLQSGNCNARQMSGASSSWRKSRKLQSTMCAGNFQKLEEASKDLSPEAWSEHSVFGLTALETLQNSFLLYCLVNREPQGCGQTRGAPFSR